MKGRRLATLAEFYSDKRLPGDYCKVTSKDDEHLVSGDNVVWYICDPRGEVGQLRDHVVVEHEDGTITVTPSINNPPDGWHGYLERGEWRSV